MKLFDSTADTTNTTGTGTLTGLGLPPTGYQTLAQAGVVDADPFVIRTETKNKATWEVCETVYSSSTKQFTRGTLLASSTGSRISFPSGTKNIYIVCSSEELAQRVLTATGDLLYRDSGGKLARLPVSTDGKVLELSGGLPSWQTAGGGGTDTPYIYSGAAPNAPFQRFVPANLGFNDEFGSAFPSSYVFYGASIIPFNAILSNLYFEGDVNSNGTDEMDVCVNGTITTLKVIVANGVKSGSDLVHTVPVSAGDHISVYYTGGGNFAKWAFAFVATKA